MEDERLSDGNHDIDGPEKGEESERSPFRDEAYKDFMRNNKKASLKDRVSQGYYSYSCLSLLGCISQRRMETLTSEGVSRASIRRI